MIHATLCFPDYATAVATAKALGFWDDTNDQLITSGQTLRTDGTAFGWGIDEIGDVPGRAGYWVNIVGELPPGLEPYLRPYGCAGRIFAGTEPDPVS